MLDLMVMDGRRMVILKFIWLNKEVEIFFKFSNIKLVNNFCENFYYNKIKICKLHVLFRKAFKLLNFGHIA